MAPSAATLFGTAVGHAGSCSISLAQCALFFFPLHRFPGHVRVETFHRLECLEGASPEVLLIDDSVVADNEGAHTGYAILGGCRNQGKAADHRSIHDKVQ